MMLHSDLFIHRAEKRCGLRCISTNTDCLHNKINEIEVFLGVNNIDVAVFVETLPKNISTKNQSVEFNIVLQGYTCLTNFKGRGIFLYIKNEFEVIKRYSDFEDLFSPSIFCKIKTLDKNFNIGAWYRSPNLTAQENEQFLKNFDIVCQNFNKDSDNFVLAGDFNFPEILWSNETCNKSDQHIATKFLNIVHDNYLTQFVDKPTHHRALQKPSLIDLIFSNDPNFINLVSHHPPFGKSHHSVLLFELDLNLNIKKVDSSRVLKFSVKKGDYVNMKKEMAIVDWFSELKEELSVDEMWGKIEKRINDSMYKFIPQRKQTNTFKIKKPFQAPDTLLQKVRLKRDAFKRYKTFPTTPNYNTYVKYRNQVKWESRKAKLNKEKDIAKLSKSNPKAFYQYVNSKTKPKENISSLLKKDGTLSKDDSEKTDILNTFFSSVFTQEDSQFIPNLDILNVNLLDNFTVTNEQMEKALHSLNVNKSPGPDEIHPVVLKELAKELTVPLKILFDKTISCGKIPSKWKVAEIRPIFKKGSKLDPSNYRPVSLTPIVCKIFETFIRDKMYDHLLINKLLSNHQYGFCKGRSCTTQLINTMQEWNSHLDNNVPVDAIYLDFRKAFDTVSHQRLLKKLYCYGIRGNLLNWVKDFLLNRYQYVTINYTNSSKVPVTSGVPQGSVLGPVLFIYFINDLPDVCNSSIKIFADDTKVYLPITSLNDKNHLQLSINRLVEWSNTWLLRFNSDKCKVLHLGKNNPEYEYTIAHDGIEKQLNISVCERDLGIMVDTKLNFEEHIESTVKKARGLAGLTNRTISYKVREVMIPIYKSIIRPILEYGNAVWSPHKRKYIDLLESVQKRFTKHIVGMNGLDYEDRLKKLCLPSLEFRRFRGDMIEMYKITHNLYDPETTNTLINYNNSITRAHKYKLLKQRVNTNHFQNFFTNRVINSWNNLPNEAVSATSLNIFKNYLDAHFRDQVYSIKLRL